MDSERPHDGSRMAAASEVWFSFGPTVTSHSGGSSMFSEALEDRLEEEREVFENSITTDTLTSFESPESQECAANSASSSSSKKLPKKKQFVLVCIAFIVTGTAGVVCLEWALYIKIPKKKLILTCLAVLGLFSCSCLCSLVPQGCRRKCILPLCWAWVLPYRCYRGRVVGEEMHCDQPCDGDCICGPCLHLYDSVCHGGSQEAAQKDLSVKRRILAASFGASIFTALAVGAAYVGGIEWPTPEGEWPKGPVAGLGVLMVSLGGTLMLYDCYAGKRRLLQARRHEHAMRRADSVEMTGLRRERCIPLPRSSSWRMAPALKPLYITAMPGWTKPWDAESTDINASSSSLS